MGSKLLIAAAVLCWPQTALSDSRPVTVRTQCHGDRCALYDRFGTRVGSITTDGAGRYVLRDARGRTTAKVSPTRGGVVVRRP